MKRNEAITSAVSLLVFIISFSVYLTTLCPSNFFGDSGELLSMSYTLGMAHPTGFPLYLLLGKVFMLMPLANVAFKINVFSALFASLTSVTLFYIMMILLKNETNRNFRLSVSFFASIIFAFSLTLWSQAVIARIYTLNAFFCAAFLLLFLYYNEIKREPKYLYLMALLTGLGTGLHLTFLLFSSIIWIYFIILNRRLFIKYLPGIVIFFITGFSVFLYYLMRGDGNTLLYWRAFYTFGDFTDYISQKQYRSKMLARDAAGNIKFMKYAFNSLLHEFSTAGFLLLITGFIMSFWKKQKYILLFTILFISNIILLSLYGNNTDLNFSFRYYIPSFMIFSVIMSLSFFHLKNIIKNDGIIYIAAPSIMLIMIFSVFMAGLKENNKSKDYLAYFYPRNIASVLPENAYIFSSGDNPIYTLAYYMYVEKKRQDVTVLDSVNTIFKTIDELQLKTGSKKIEKNILEALKRNFTPLYSMIMTNNKLFYELQNGIVYEISDKPLSPSPSFWNLYSLKGIIDDTDISSTFVEREVIGSYLYALADYYMNIGNINRFLYFQAEAEKRAFDSVTVLGNCAILYSKAGYHTKAISLLEHALTLQPFNTSLLFNLGSAYAQNEEFSKAAETFKIVTEKDGTNLQAFMYMNKAKQQAAEKASAEAYLKLLNENFDKGLELFKQKKFDEAEEYFNKDLEKNPSSARSYFHLGLINSFRNQMETAQEMFEKAYERDSKSITTINNLALTYLKTGNKKKAEKLFNESLEIKRDQPRVEKILLQIKK